MALTIAQHTPQFSTAPQITLANLPEIVAQGFKTIINNRPDGEGGSAQVTSAELELATKSLGLNYYYFPVVSGRITEEQANGFANLLTSTSDPILAFCRTGTRSKQLWTMALNGNSSTVTTGVVAEHNAGAASWDWSGQQDIVIVGGGAAGIGMAASLLKRQSNLQITIIEPSDKHYYQPAWTLVGGGQFNIKDTVKNMADVMPKSVSWIKAAVVGFSPEKNEVQLDNGKSIHYQYLVVAPGLQLNWQAIDGLEETLGKNSVTSNYRFDLAPYTWELVQKTKSGRAIFTQPPMPIKCAGAPQKAMYLACSEWYKQGIIKNIEVEMYNAGAVLFGVATFVPPLMEYVKKYNAHLNFNASLYKIDGPNKTAYFKIKDADGNVTSIERKFDMIHVVPPQSAPNFVKESTLANADGWVEVDQFTLQHPRFPNIFSVGDVCSAPNAKTAAAARKQVVVAAENLIALRSGDPLPTKYDGYGSCPLTVEVGKIVLAEFGYGGKLLPTFPINPAVPRRSAWFLKKTILPWLYWNAMLKGREWLAKSMQN